MNSKITILKPISKFTKEDFEEQERIERENKAFIDSVNEKCPLLPFKDSIGNNTTAILSFDIDETQQLIKPLKIINKKTADENYNLTLNYYNTIDKNIKFSCRTEDGKDFECSYYAYCTTKLNKNDTSYSTNLFCILDGYVYKCFRFINSPEHNTTIYGARLVNCTVQSDSWTMKYANKEIEMKTGYLYCFEPYLYDFKVDLCNRIINDVSFISTQYFEIYDSIEGGEMICNVPACTAFSKDDKLLENVIYVRQHPKYKDSLAILQNRYTFNADTQELTHKAAYIKFGNYIPSIKTPNKKVYVQLPGIFTTVEGPNENIPIQIPVRIPVPINHQLNIHINKDAVGLYKIITTTTKITPHEYFEKIKPSYY
jgi:hypothetical protein